MKKAFRLSAILLSITIIFIACKKNNNDEPIPIPSTVTLSTPSNSAACIQGTSANGVTASVEFTWSAASNVESYQIVIKDLSLQTSLNYTTTSTSYTAKLNTNTPYSWYIMAKNSSGNTTSDTWKFYLSATPASNYIPFPADLTTPALGATINSNGAATVQVTFQWTGSDPDNNIASYAFYLDNTNASKQVVAAQTTTSFTQNISTGTYFWKIVTTDKAGNTSTSTVCTFCIK